MAKFKPLPPLEELRARFDYDSETGSFGKGSRKKGYVLLYYKKQQYLAHRIAWYLHYGVDPGDAEVEHINQKRDDNRICNLRLATRAENSWNVKDYKGWYFYKRTGKWGAKIQLHNKQIHIGYFLTVEEAKAAYYAKAVELRGEFAPQAWRQDSA